LAKGLERQLQSFRRTVKASGTADCAQSDLITIQFGPERVAVVREVTRDFNTRFCEDREICEASSLRAEEFFDLFALSLQRRARPNG
jgi:hypothetical protein